MVNTKGTLDINIKPVSHKKFVPVYSINGTNGLPGIPTCEALLVEQEDKNKHKTKLANITVSLIGESLGSYIHFIRLMGRKNKSR